MSCCRSPGNGTVETTVQKLDQEQQATDRECNRHGIIVPNDDIFDHILQEVVADNRRDFFHVGKTRPVQNYHSRIQSMVHQTSASP